MHTELRNCHFGISTCHRTTDLIVGNVLFDVFETGCHSAAQAGLELTICGPDWPQALNTLPALASLVLEL